MKGNPQRLAILRHVARYGITLRPVLDRLFYGNRDGASAEQVAYLKREGLIHVVENAIGEVHTPQTRYSYYYLTTAGARQLGASPYVTRKRGGLALARNLAFLWFAMGRSTRQSGRPSDSTRWALDRRKSARAHNRPQARHAVSCGRSDFGRVGPSHQFKRHCHGDCLGNLCRAFDPANHTAYATRSTDDHCRCSRCSRQRNVARFYGLRASIFTSLAA